MEDEKYNFCYSNFSKDLAEILQGSHQFKSFYDVLLVCNDAQVFKTSKMLLSSVSSFFSELFMSTKDSDVIYLEEINSFTVDLILKFVYLGEINVPNKMIILLKKSAKSLKIKPLIELTLDLEQEPVTIKEDFDEIKPINIKSELRHIDQSRESDPSITLEEKPIIQPKLEKAPKEEPNQPPKQREKCPKCDKTYTSLHGVYQHYKSTHEGALFPCNECSYVSTFQSNLSKHVAKVHLRIKYPCSLCDSELSSKSELKTHEEKVHMGIKHPCSLCDTKLCSKKQLRSHERGVHKKFQK